MSIPLERLYHYIESVANEIRNDDIVIYRFAPHGSKKLEDLITRRFCSWMECSLNPEIYCFDQEPLTYDQFDSNIDPTEYLVQNKLVTENIRKWVFNIYDKCLLLHSEQNSLEVKKYQNSQFIPVYYWSHAIIARDWFRYANHVKFKKDPTKSKTFLIYNRAWSGTREYRLKFVDLLINHNLISHCQTSFNAVEPELQLHYKQHQFDNPIWEPANCLEDHLLPTQAPSWSSADFNLDDYKSTNFEVVLETLFDDSRIQLTEKILRPIACNQPFLLLSAAGSLKYLQRYGFKTFDSVFDESYDSITDPCQRMSAVVKTMSTITNWSDKEKAINMAKINQITEYNQKYFFSNDFFELITNELKQNLKNGLEELESTNTSERYLTLRKILGKNPICKTKLIDDTPARSRQDVSKAVKVARTYYNRYLKSINK